MSLMSRIDFPGTLPKTGAAAMAGIPARPERPQWQEFPQDRSGRKEKTTRKTGNDRKGKVDHKGRNGQATKKLRRSGSFRFPFRRSLRAFRYAIMG